MGYPVFTYASCLLLVLVAAAQTIGYAVEWRIWLLSDKALIMLGCAGRCATRLLLLYGNSLEEMQIMQLAYSMGLLAEVVLYSYVLKILPLEQTQRLTSITQGCYL